MCGLDSSCSGYGPMADYCEHDNKRSDSIKFREFIDYLSDYRLLEKDCSPWIWLFSCAITAFETKCFVDSPGQTASLGHSPSLFPSIHSRYRLVCSSWLDVGVAAKTFALFTYQVYLCTI